MCTVIYKETFLQHNYFFVSVQDIIYSLFPDFIAELNLTETKGTVVLSEVSKRTPFQ